jgi:hypothetical protein
MPLFRYASSVYGQTVLVGASWDLIWWFGGFKPGGVVIDMSSSDPLATLEFARQLAERDILLVDAPALGTPADARAGKLTLIGGGEQAVVERCQPIFAVLAAHTLHAGPVGSGQAGAALGDFFARRRDSCRERGAAHRPAFRVGCGIGDRDRRVAERRWSSDGCPVA